jgi:hypothetical protein
MRFSVSHTRIFPCDIARAFKTPMLCRVTKVHTGLGPMPRITHTTEDKHWGQIGSSKKVYAASSWTQKGGYVSKDHVLERIENQRWKIRVDDFQSWMLGFYQFEGTWETERISEHQTKVIYSYDLFANNILLYPLQWLFAQLFWRRYMSQVLDNIQRMCEEREEYLYL